MFVRFKMTTARYRINILLGEKKHVHWLLCPSNSFKLNILNRVR
jgi:hypothetical protein